MISLKSKTTIKILNYFFLNPKAKNYINELAKILDLDPKNLYRKLRELEKEGILESEFLGKQRYFYLSKSPIVEAYRQIILKTVGFESLLKKVLNKIKGIKEAYLFGSYARDKMDTSSDIDLLVIGNHSPLILQKEIIKLQREIDREINIINMSEKEFKEKKNKDPFIKNIFSDKFIKIK